MQLGSIGESATLLCMASGHVHIRGSFWTFELLLHLDPFFSSQLQKGDKLCTNHKWN